MFINAGVLHGGRVCSWERRKAPLGGFSSQACGGGIDSIFWQKYLQPLLKDSSLSAVRLDGPEPWRKEAVSTSLEAWEACREERSGYEFQVRGSLSRLIYLLASHRPAVSGRVSEQEARRWERIKIMLQFIQEHCGERISPLRISPASAMISESECLRCFPQHHWHHSCAVFAAAPHSESGGAVGLHGPACGGHRLGVRLFRRGLFCKNLSGDEGVYAGAISGQ